MKKILFVLLGFCSFSAFAQQYPDFTVAKAEILDKDTVATINLREVVIFHKDFASDDERRAFERLKRNTLKVYPYVEIAVGIYKEMQEDTDDLKRRKKKKLVKQREEELREKFEADIRKLTKSQGNILIKLINRETGNNCYQIIKDMKGPLTAFAWNIAGKMYDQDLKEDYKPEENPDLELIVRMIKDEQLPVNSFK